MNKSSLYLKVISLLLVFCSATLVVAIPNRTAYLPGLHYSFEPLKEWTVSFKYNAVSRKYVDMVVFPGIVPYYQHASIYTDMPGWRTFTMTPYGFYRDTVVLVERPTDVELEGVNEIIEAIEENFPSFNDITKRK